MSTTHPIALPDGKIKTVRKLTYREARYVQERLKAEDCSRAEAARRAGFPAWMLHEVNRTIEVGEVARIIEELQATLAEHAVEAALVDAAELHEQLSDEVRGDLADLYNDEGDLLPVASWPRWARLGGVEVLDEPNMVHSADGAEGSWDQVGRRIKVKAGSRMKARELLAKMKAVDALVKVIPEAGDVHIHVTIEDKLQRARLLAAGDVIDVVPESTSTPIKDA